MFRKLALGSVALVPLLFAPTAEAQRVQADIRIFGGPVAGRVVIGDRYGGRPRVPYYAPRRVYVERVYFRDHGRRVGWYKKFRRAPVVVVYYDRRDDRFYDGFRPGLQEIRVYEQDDRYYWPQDDRYYDDRYDPRYDDRYDDRYGGRYDGRYDDRYDGRYGGRYDSCYDGRDGRYDRRDDRYRCDDRYRRDRRKHGDEDGDDDRQH